jgi:hypothetical protein
MAHAPGSRLFLSLGLLVGAAFVAAAPAPPEGKLTDKELAQAEKAAKQKLEDLKGSHAQFRLIKDEALTKAFPRTAFFAVIFRQFPVARVTPKGLKSANVFAVGANGKVQILNDAAGLEKFFKAQLPPAKGKADLERSCRAWLDLDQVLHQDGFFRFKVLADSLKVAASDRGKSVSGTVVPMAGGSGTLTASLTFNEDGKLTQIQTTNKLRPGPRPICQATKLLDRDLLVRRMAEQDLLIMGRLAKPYLDEQRVKASPELRQAIDRLWQRICATDR